MAKIRIKVKVKGVGDPKIPIYKITVRDENNIWEETYGSKELAKAFLQGLKAAFSFTEVGHIITPPMPPWKGF